MYTCAVCHQHTKSQFLPREKVHHAHTYVFAHSAEHWVHLLVRGLHTSSLALLCPAREEPLLPSTEEEAGVIRLNSGRAAGCRARWLRSPLAAELVFSDSTLPGWLSEGLSRTDVCALAWDLHLSPQLTGNLHSELRNATDFVPTTG